MESDRGWRLVAEARGEWCGMKSGCLCDELVTCDRMIPKAVGFVRAGEYWRYG